MPSDRRAVVDSAGREVVLSGRPRRIFPTGNAAAAAVWCLSPAALLGWPPARPGEAPLLAVAHASVPRIARADPAAAAVAALSASGADLVLDFGDPAAPFVAFADLVQRETGIPAAVVDGRLARTGEALSLLGRLLGLTARAETLAAEWERARRAVAAARTGAARPKVHYAIGPRGERAARRGSIHLDPLGLVGAVAAPDIAAGARSRVAMDPAAAVAADPDLIVTTDPRFRACAASLAPWADLAAVRAGRIHLAPAPVLSWFDRPPSLNRIIGLRWLARLCYGDRYRGDLERGARAFHRLFYRAILPPGFRAG